MSFRSLVQSNVSKAFNSIGDLAVSIELQQRQAENFNFSSGDVERGVPVSKMLKAVYVEKKKNGVTSIQYLVDASTLPDPVEYDTLIANGISWKIVHPCKTDGFLTYITVSGGVNG